MRWYHYVALFFAGAFLVNFVPHFTNGISGRPFPSPFASPPGQGMSSPLVNVLFSMVLHPPKQAPNPLLYLGFVLAAAGAGMVLYFKPQS